MYRQVEKPEKSKNRILGNVVSQRKGDGRKSSALVDNRPENRIGENNPGMGVMSISPQVLQQGLPVEQNSPLVNIQGAQHRSINKEREAVKQLICLDKKKWTKVSDDDYFSAAHISTENFDTVAEYDELITNNKDSLGDILVEEIQKECETRYSEAQEQRWYITAKHLGFDVEGMIKEKDFDISNSVWNETLDKDELFFHGTRRTPEETLGSLDGGTKGTGFVAEDLRAERVKQSQVVPPVKWRTGFDDINLKSAVCLAKDVRGSAFFPLTGEVEDQQRELDDQKPIYLYAIRVKAGAKVVNTYGAQSRLEEFENPPEKAAVSDINRLQYDPGYEINDGENADCRWQFQEHAVSEVTPDQIVGVWRVERIRFIETNLEGGERAGIRFRIHEESQFDPIVKPAEGSGDVASHAKNIISQYAGFYPKDPQHYLSYMGIVRDMAEGGSKPASFSDARSAVEPVIYDVTNREFPGRREADH